MVEEKNSDDNVKGIFSLKKFFHWKMKIFVKLTIFLVIVRCRPLNKTEKNDGRKCIVECDEEHGQVVGFFSFGSLL